ncbi:hypothetical protein [Legionella fallonii]|uniref:Uncharacterized protein n=1 Tax=Legionella fallonii LLAP-10 TaxID=1212491 RepID=A0A098G8W7_9GAMM|nr:hypothetical protein [Legionella fallonii]CEG58939.1 conserved protein of unknown function [Legionella fallonii LLAP-10]
MGWWSSVVDGAKFVYQGLGTLANGATSSAKWLWNNTSVKKAGVAVFKYGFNTFFEGIDQIKALQKAIPTLVNNESARQIVNEVAHLVTYDVLPMVTLNAINNGVQNYFREGYPDDAPWLAPYTLFLSSLTLVNYGVTAYTWRQGSQASVRMLALAVYGPPAFNSNKEIALTSNSNKESIPTPSSDEGIGEQLNGIAREPIILAANDGLAWGVSFIPGIGPKAALFIRVLSNGRYITRLVTPERPENDKAMKQESVLALGLSYELSCVLMDLLFEHTVGLPPFLYHRILKQVLLLLHVNTAAHMNIPSVKPEDATIWPDPLNTYEWICRFISNVIFAGLIKRIPIDFKRPKDVPPLIPLSSALQFMTAALRSDLKKEDSSPVTEPVVPLVASRDLVVLPTKSQALTVQPKEPWKLPSSLQRFEGVVNDPIGTLKFLALPPMFRSVDGLINDDIIFRHWSALREGWIGAIDAMKTYGKSNAAATLAWAPKSVAAVLYWKFGVAKGVTRTVLMLTQEKDFWDLANALKAWFERHDVKFEVKLADRSRLALSGGIKKIELPSVISDSSPVVPAKTLISERKLKPVISANDLVPTRKQSTSSPISPQSLLTTRKREGVSKTSGTKHDDEQRTVPTLSISNPESLFTTRKRRGGSKISEAAQNDEEKTVSMYDPEDLLTTRRRGQRVQDNDTNFHDVTVTEHTL